REGEVEDIDATAQAIALGALNYYLLQTTPSKDMIFNPKESLSFTGNTGPYLQYMGARISSMLEKYREMDDVAAKGKFRPELLVEEDEKSLVKLLTAFPEAVADAGAQLAPSVITGYLYELSKTYSRYYHDNPILKNDDPDLVVTRITLSKAVLQVLENAFSYVGIPFLSSM
ncbi:MAG TPA: DALR anticodon-binding domain-containing protein, partial [Spirochaetia bacterium]|nr:DALR anticodon-binding domain-containing protein [Spirochaetia bacterium]